MTPPLSGWQHYVMYCMDVTIRFMALFGAFGLAFTGIFLGWWDNTVGMGIYAFFFCGGLLYTSEYNGREWTTWNDG